MKRFKNTKTKQKENFMTDKEYDFHYYALNYNFNERKIEFFNVFNNILVYEHTVKDVNDYWKGKYTLEEFINELDHIIMWQEWSRCEYEIAVGYLFEEDMDKFEKIDCYQQAHANIDLVAQQVINEFKKKHPKIKKIEKSLS